MGSAPEDSAERGDRDATEGDRSVEQARAWWPGEHEVHSILVWEPEDLDKLLSTLRDRVDQRWRAGEYPVGLEEQLAEHFAQLTVERPPPASMLLDQLEAARARLHAFEFARHLHEESRIPGGKMAHRVINKAITRQIEDIIDQTQEHAQAVDRAVALLTEVVAALAQSYDAGVVQQVGDLQTRLADERAELHGIALRLDDLAARVPGAPIDTWYSSDDFNNDFRGGTEWVMDRYRDLVPAFAGCDPVLEVGFGRGEFLELLREAGIDAWGIEPDATAVDAARMHGLRAEKGTAIEYLRDLDDGSLGGLVMIQVIEHLTPQGVVDVVRLAADKVRPGGRVLIETVNPTSLYTYAHAFWVDPDHTRPVHPRLLEFLFKEAHFASVERLDRSRVPDDERLELLPGDDEATRVMNANLQRIDSLLFGPQDYAILATR